MPRANRLLVVWCFAALFAGSCSKVRTPAAASGAVTLLISPAGEGAPSAMRRNGEVTIACEATINNRTGAPIVVKSSFYSAFDGLSVVVRTKDGRTLGRTSYLEHQSPFSLEPREFSLPEGETTRTLSFVTDYIAADVGAIVIEVVGNLPQSSFGGKLESNSITIEVQK